MRGTGQNFAIESNTGFVQWNTEDATDLDYSPLPLATRNNEEDDRQFTQEVRISSPANAPLAITDRLMLKWQAGVEYFNQAYEQDAVNTLSAFVLNPQMPFPVAMTSPESSIDSDGIGLFGRGHPDPQRQDRPHRRPALRSRIERRAYCGRFSARRSPLRTSSPPRSRSRTYRRSLPSRYRVNPQHNVYASAARGYKAGGYNPAALPGSEAYGEEHAWHVEGGVKSSLVGGKVAASAAVFFIDWDDLQLNVPNPFVPGQFYIANVGGASSSGIEFDVTARPHQLVDVFASFGYTNASFADGTWSMGVDVSGNNLPFTPDYTALFGAQLNRSVTSSISGFVRGEVVLSGAFEYDDANTARPGGVFDRQHPRRRAQQVPLRRGLGAQRVRDAVCANRDSLPVCAVGLHRREWPASHLRRQSRSDVLMTTTTLTSPRALRLARARWCRARRRSPRSPSRWQRGT